MMIGQEKSNEIETVIWETLEPYLEGPINLDLNEWRDNIAFAELVADVTHAVTKQIRTWGFNE